MENNNSAVQFNFAKVRIRPRAGYVHFACSQYPHSPGTLLDVDVADPRVIARVPRGRIACMIVANSLR